MSRAVILAPKAPPKPISVAVVEDDAQTRRILVEWVGTAPGFTVIAECGDAERALSVLPGNPPDVALVDINLPGLTGSEVVRRLKPLLAATQFIMLTVYQDADHIYDALASGACGYLLKRTPREELLAALQDVHNGGSPMTSTIARKVVQSFAQSAHARSADESLSPREQEVLDLLARGYFVKEVASRLNLSMGSVKTYVRRMYEKLHVRSRTQAVAKYARLGQAS